MCYAQTGHFDRFKKLIEDAVAQHHRPAVIISHSMGSLVTLYLLTHLTDKAWRWVGRWECDQWDISRRVGIMCTLACGT